MAKPPGVANGQLTELQRGFVVAFVRNGGNATQAAEAAGYKYERLDRAGHDALKSTAVQAAIQSEIRRALSVDLAGLALGVVRGILEDPTMEPKIRLDAAKVALDRGGYVAPKAADASSGDLKAVEEMSIAELESYIAKSKHEAAQRAIPVMDLDATEVIG